MDTGQTERLKHLVGTDQLTDRVLQRLFARSDEMRAMPRRKALDVLRGMQMATFFWGESTRTRCSFEVAMHRLGGDVSATVDAGKVSSVSKGESFQDTVMTIGQYVDVIVMRHDVKGTLAQAPEFSPVPVINAADGAGDHPTQALLDMHTIERELGRLDNLTVVMAGDCKRSRTIHPLATLLMRYGAQFIFVSRESLMIPAWLRDTLRTNGSSIRETTNLREAVAEADIVYMTRDQDNLANPTDRADYQAGEPIVLRADMLHAAKKRMAIMHPLPRRSEIERVVDYDPRAAYFRQVENGLYDRMGLLAELLGA